MVARAGGVVRKETFLHRVSFLVRRGVERTPPRRSVAPPRTPPHGAPRVKKTAGELREEQQKTERLQVAALAVHFTTCNKTEFFGSGSEALPENAGSRFLAQKARASPDPTTNGVGCRENRKTPFVVSDKTVTVTRSVGVPCGHLRPTGRNTVGEHTD